VVGLVGERSQEVELLLGQLARRPLDVALRARLADLTDLEDTSARVDAEPDRTYHVSNLQAPVFDADGGVALALTLPGLFLELTGHEIAKLGGELTAAARMLTRQLSGRAPAMPGIGVSA
jgi:DNA-binding IclR family transcriptional regulator